ncbi:hypothetical protein [Microbacterium sp. JAI119]|uniref:hypothetical protein n=1 Tax=Microbacterium sp. JAI119 TaxID=2723062 RepID=UPI0015CCA76B|nr:hypothetical protein [Microbacterium sp. JAI119]NYF29243.1 hypothetical protein [Microbacterium sp. JAI119]
MARALARDPRSGTLTAARHRDRMLCHEDGTSCGFASDALALAKVERDPENQNGDEEKGDPQGREVVWGVHLRCSLG